MGPVEAARSTLADGGSIWHGKAYLGPCFRAFHVDPAV